MGIRASLLIALGVSACAMATPDPPEMVRAEADAAYASGDLVSAVSLLPRVIQHQPSDSASYAALADTYRRGGWTIEGREWFRAAVAKPRADQPELRYYLAFFSGYTGQPDSAEYWLAQARSVRPPTYSEAITLADVLAGYGRYERAIELLRGAAAMRPPQHVARERLVAVLTRAGRLDDAKANADTLGIDFPDRASSLGTRAHLAFRTGDLTGSEELTFKWLAAAPNNAEALWNLMRIAMQRGQWARSDSLLSTIVATGH